jgi:adenylate cyclase
MDRLIAEVLLLTSKEVLERTGISRATLNNYIGSGIVPRPEVLPPGPEHGDAPRIGYFPDEVIARIEEIHRLKREGWSIQRIAERFAESSGGAKLAQRAVQPGSAVAPAAVHRVAPILEAGSGFPGLSIEEVTHPAYLVGRNFDVLWTNEAAHANTWPNLVALPVNAITHSIFRYLALAGGLAPDQRKAILGFHLAFAKQRGVPFSDLLQDIPAQEIAGLQRLYAESSALELALVAQTTVPAPRSAGAKAVSLYALQLREGTLFLYVPGSAAPATPLLTPAPAETPAIARRVPALSHVAVLVTELQDAARLWAELPPEEYFELINQLWMTVEPIFARNRGAQGKHPGEGMVCYFLPQGDQHYLWNALLAAQQVREAVRRVSKEWQLKKGWTTELYLNTGIDEGQEWHGSLGPGSRVEFTVLGDAVNQAARISSVARSGAIWVTKNLVGKLSAEDRGRLKYGVYRRTNDGRDLLVPAVFCRVENLMEAAAVSADALKAVARLPVTEILEIAPETHPADRAADRPAES